MSFDCFDCQIVQVMIDLACDPNFFSEPLKGKEPRETSDEGASEQDPLNSPLKYHVVHQDNKSKETIHSETVSVPNNSSNLRWSSLPPPSYCVIYVWAWITKQPFQSKEIFCCQFKNWRAARIKWILPLNFIFSPNQDNNSPIQISDLFSNLLLTAPLLQKRRVFAGYF